MIVGISVLGYFMTEAWHLWLLAVAVALVQGGSQALSRSLFATLIPAGKSSEFFAFYSVSGKFGNVIGPLVLFAKIVVLTFIVFWVRFTMPRFREDQLQRLAWKFLIPIALANIVVTGVLKVAF